MDLSFLDKSSQVAPLLVKLYDSQKLGSLAQDRDPLARAELTSAIYQLLEMDLSPRESELIADVMIQLMRQAELDLRQALAEKLSVMDNVPLRLVLQMANDDISVAGSVLSKSMILSDLDLIYIIKAKGADYWQSIAKRKTMSDQIINILVDTNELETVDALIKNKNITLTEYAVDVAADMACEHEPLAKPLLQREEVTPEIAKRLYHHVGQALKDFINEEYHLGLCGDSVADLIDEVVIDLCDVVEGEQSCWLPTTAHLKDAARYHEKGLLTIKLMLVNLRRSQIRGFIAQFSKFTGMPVETVIDILSQQSGQGLAVACRAFEIVKADFVSIYLLTNCVRSDEKMADLKDMSKAISYFDRIDSNVAKDIIKNSLD